MPTSVTRTACRVAVALLTVWALLPAPAAAQSDDDPETGETADTAADSPVPLDRQQAVDMAVRNNHDVRISRKRTDIAERNVALGNAGLLPSLEATASQNHQFGGPGLFGQQQIYTRTSLGVQLDWLLFAGLGRLATFERLKAERSVARLVTEAEVETTLLSVTTAYWKVVQQKELVQALAETVQISRERVDIAQARLDAGVGSKVQLNVARVELNRDKSSVAQQHIALTRAKTALNQALGRDADTDFTVDDELEVTRGLTYSRLRRRALNNNRRLLVAQREKTVATDRIDEVKSERWPTLGMTLGYNYSGFHSGVIPNFDTEPALEYGLNLSVPLFQGLNVRRRIDNSQTERTVADIQVQQQRTRILAELKDAHAAYTRHLERVELAEQSIDIAEDNVDIALTQLEAGTISQVELRQVQENLLNARTTLVNATFQAKEAALRLHRLTGQLYDDLSR